SGDNVFIIKGTNTSTPSLSDFIWGYSTRSWITSSSTNANTSYLPSTLISYSTTHSSASVNDGYFANGSSSTTSLTISNTDKCAIINLIINPAKWYTSTSSTALSPPDYNIGFATTISYASSTYCKSGSASVTLTGTSGGIYSGSSGLSINSSGTIDLAASIAGIQYAYYTYIFGGCSQTTFTTVVISSGTTASFTINTNPQCLSGNNFVFTNTSTNGLGVVSNLNGGGAASNIAVALSNFNISVASGSKLLVRMYVFGGATNSRSLYNKNVTISGSTSVASSVNWALTSDATTNTTTGSGVTSNGETIGSGITDGGFDATNGHQLTSNTTWPTNLNTSYYEQFSVSVSGGTAFSFNSLTATQRIANGSGTINLLFLYSTDGGTTFNVLPSSATVAGSSTVNNLTYNWNFGDATISTATSPTKSYSSINTYTVSLTVSDGVCTSANTSQTVTVATGPTITTQPSTTNISYCINTMATALSVAATGTSPTYQWYSNTTASNSGGTLISGATSNSYIPPISSVGITYYYCVVSDASCSLTTNISGSITVNANPSISSQPSTSAQTRCQNVAATALSIIATAGSGSISGYQWYSNSTNSNSGGILISGATSSSYTPPTTSIGTTYYYCIVTNSNTCSTTSNVSG
ncbi:MAG: PKD domain-containing protein, partial [Bacteroidetes bacterium]|nr:PKD domain-containing protein [Bacteroidota bacterium]